MTVAGDGCGELALAQSPRGVFSDAHKFVMEAAEGMKEVMQFYASEVMSHLHSTA
jgi:hypothetical protein